MHTVGTCAALLPSFMLLTTLPTLPAAAVVTSLAWRELKAVSAREGLVAAAYERRHGAHSRVLQVAKLYCFGASSGGW